MSWLFGICRCVGVNDLTLRLKTRANVEILKKLTTELFIHNTTLVIRNNKHPGIHDKISQS